MTHHRTTTKVITKSRIVKTARKMPTATIKKVKSSVLRRLGPARLRKLGGSKVRKMIKRAVERKAVRILRSKGYESACRGECGRSMRSIARKARSQRKHFRKTVRGLRRFRERIIKKELKKIGFSEKKISKKSYKIKQAALNARLAGGLMTRAEWKTYSMTLRSWVIISRSSYKTRVRRLKQRLSERRISKRSYHNKISYLRKRRASRTRISRS